MRTIKRIWKTFIRGWMAFWLAFAWVQAFIILLIVYFIPLGLTSLICRITRRDFLHTGTRGRETFWLDRPEVDTSLERAQRQF